MIELYEMTGDAPEGARALMEAVLFEACRMEGIADADAGVRLIGDEAIRALNRQTRSVDAPTDVLSFPSVAFPDGTACDHPRLLRREIDPETGRAYLGDIAISLERACAQAEEYGHSLMRELGYLTAHAALHLMGYDHMKKTDKAAMRSMEEAIMRQVNLLRENEGEPMTDEALHEKALEAMKNAYVPYSNFPVGACLLAEDGRVFTGCNVENASYGATICAERTAILKAVSEGARRFVAMAVAAEKAEAWPCGQCRQVINEFAAPDMRLIVGQQGGALRTARFSELLPHSFGANQMQDKDA